MLKILTLTLFFASVIVNAQDTSEPYKINKEDLLNYVSILSSPEYGGRLAGSPGYNQAAKFAADKFAGLGLKPAGDKGYFKFFNIEYNRIDTPAVFKVITMTDTTNYDLGKDFVMRGFTGSNRFTLPVVFCGYGISRPDLEYDDYAGVNVKNKIVMVFKYNPGWKVKDSSWGEGYPREKSLTAIKHGQKEFFLCRFRMIKNRSPLSAACCTAMENSLLIFRSFISR